MELPRTSALLPRVIWRDRVTSTNTELAELVKTVHDLPHATLLVSDCQSAGRGRLQRNWHTLPGKTLALSLLLRWSAAPALAGQAQWVPLVAAAAVCQGLAPLIAAANPALKIGIKWPNDVQLRASGGANRLKLAGILCEILPAHGVIVGIGINLFTPAEQLPTAHATSLLAAGAIRDCPASFTDPAGAELADRVVFELCKQLLRQIEEAESWPEAILPRLQELSFTLGEKVRVELPGGEHFSGLATALAYDGALIVSDGAKMERAVHAGDVVHLR